jgi:lipopolysaccharide/colanic/teichoic acid biosynthesis glycosyltransferase
VNASIINIPHTKQQTSTPQDPHIKSYTNFEYAQKRAIDFLLSFLLIIAALPVVAITIIRIKKESLGPIFFKQTRIGLHGKPFTCYKFRSMHLHKVTEDGVYTQDHDLRIFPYGQFMRKTRIDELPQIINVIKGEMHLIGPRAEWDILSTQYEKQIKDYEKRYLVRPGITGLAQVSYPYGRNIYDAEQKLNYDLEYIKNWSIISELKVIFKTIGVVLGKKGL